MSIGILIVTHGEIGDQLVKAAGSTLGGKLPLNCRTLSVTQKCEPDSLIANGNQLVESLNSGSGVLVLTDIFGSTPSNIANSLDRSTRLQVVTGVNLPMLIRVLNYPKLSLEKLTEKALSGGHDGIMLCTKNDA